MNYFKVLGIAFGLAAMLKPFYMHVLPWDENTFIEKFYHKERPAWIIPIALAGLLLVAFTWYRHFTLDIPYSIVLTILFSLTVIKAALFLFDYQRFQKWVAGMLKKESGKQIVKIDIAAGIFGLIIVVLSALVY